MILNFKNKTSYATLINLRYNFVFEVNTTIMRILCRIPKLSLPAEEAGVESPKLSVFWVVAGVDPNVSPACVVAVLLLKLRVG